MSKELDRSLPSLPSVEPSRGDADDRTEIEIAATRASTVGETEWQRRAREAEEAKAARMEEERWAAETWYAEQRQIRAIKADARAQRGAGNVAFGRGAAVVGGTTLTGFLIGGPVGAIGGAAVGWIADRLIGGGRR